MHAIKVCLNVVGGPIISLIARCRTEPEIFDAWRPTTKKIHIKFSTLDSHGRFSTGLSHLRFFTQTMHDSYVLSPVKT